MKVLKRTTDLLILHPGYSNDIWFMVFYTVALPIYLLFFSNLSMFLKSLLLCLVPLFVFVIIDEWPPECTFDKNQNSLITRRFALFDGWAKRYTLSDIKYVDINSHFAYKYSVKLQTDGEAINLQSGLNRKNANKLAQQVGVFLDIPYTKAYLD